LKLTRFDTTRDLIFVPGRLWGPHEEQYELNLVLDTGAAETIVIPQVLDDLGYSARQHGEQIAAMRSAVGFERGYMLRVARFECLGFRETDFRVHAQDLPEGWGIHGLIGLSFLRQLNYEVRSRDGEIRVERV
jgi:predicted aspartyl protease